MLNRLIADESGQSLVEYGLIIGLVSVGLVAALTGMRVQLMNVFNSVGTVLQRASHNM